MSERRNVFSGKMEVKNKITERAHELEVSMPGIDATDGLVAKTNRVARATVNLELGRSVEYGNYSFKISMGGSVDVTEEDFFSGAAHDIIANHIGNTIIPFIENLDENWIPKASQIQGRVVLLVPNND